MKILSKLRLMQFEDLFYRLQCPVTCFMGQATTLSNIFSQSFPMANFVDKKNYMIIETTKNSLGKQKSLP